MKPHEVASKQRAPPDVYYSDSSDDDEDASPEARDARDPQQPMLKKKNKQPASTAHQIPLTALFQSLPVFTKSDCYNKNKKDTIIYV